MTEEERLVFKTQWAELRRIHKVHNLYKEYARAFEACQTQGLRDRKIKEVTDEILKRSVVLSKVLGLAGSEIIELTTCLKQLTSKPLYDSSATSA